MANWQPVPTLRLINGGKGKKRKRFRKVRTVRIVRAGDVVGDILPSPGKVKNAMRTVDAKVKLVRDTILRNCQTVKSHPQYSPTCAPSKVRDSFMRFQREWLQFYEDNRGYWSRLWTYEQVQEYARRVNKWIRKSAKYGLPKDEVIRIEKGMDWGSLAWGAIALFAIALYARSKR